MRLGFYVTATIAFIGISFFFFVDAVQAEPWLVNRYAQNCAACHSPGRRNLETRDRRCTLTCQSCHANPNGGGMRNEYGMWNQQRWLRSYKSEKFRSKGMPAPYKYQKYAQVDPAILQKTRAPQAENKPAPKPVEHRDGKGKVKLAKGKKLKNGKNPNVVPEPAKLLKESEIKPVEATANLEKQWQKMAEDGTPLVVLPGTEWNPNDFGNGDGQDRALAGSQTEFMAHITEDDPYRLEQKQTVFAGGDFRYLFSKMDKKRSGATAGPDISDSSLFARALDLGIRFRPMADNLQAVFEHRYLQEPTTTENVSSDRPEQQSSPEKVFYDYSQVRSAYVLVNHLPWNSYMMYGLYTPLFGHENPDATTLLNNIRHADNRVTGGDAFDAFESNAAADVHKAFTFGAAPGPVSINVHWIQPTDRRYAANKFSQESGYAATLAYNARVLGGFYVMGSWWATTGPRGVDKEKLKNSMYSVTSGFSFRDVIVNVDYTSVDREFQAGSSDAGSVSSVEFKYRLMKEIYGVANYASANTARNLKAGKATEMMYGVKSFLYPGTEFELLMINREDQDTVNALKTSTSMLQAQAHLFF